MPGACITACSEATGGPEASAQAHLWAAWIQHKDRGVSGRCAGLEGEQVAGRAPRATGPGRDPAKGDWVIHRGELELDYPIRWIDLSGPPPAWPGGPADRLRPLRWFKSSRSRRHNEH